MSFQATNAYVLSLASEYASKAACAVFDNGDGSYLLAPLDGSQGVPCASRKELFKELRVRLRAMRRRGGKDVRRRNPTPG
jgi:hypothetical protein